VGYDDRYIEKAIAKMTREKITPLSHGAQNHCFGCGAANRTGLRLKFFTDDKGRILSRLKVPKRFEGPPGYMHGGAIATLMDEAMSKANRARGVTAMTRQMEVEYLRPVPLGVPLLLEGRLTKVDGRKHFCEAEVTNEEGRVLAKAKGLFLAIDPAVLAHRTRA
jgi:uncharacterized protein (TIGR00369 family)